MKGFGGFKSSPNKLKQNYEKGFKNMSDLQLKNVIKRNKARGNSKETAFESIKDAETSIDSIQTAQKELERRAKKSSPAKAMGGYDIREKMKPGLNKENVKKIQEGIKNYSDDELAGVIKRNLYPNYNFRNTVGSAGADSTQAAINIIKQKRSPAKKNEKLIEKAASMGKKGTEMLKKVFDIPVTRAYRGLSNPTLGFKPRKKVKYPKIAEGVKPSTSKTDQEVKALQATYAPRVKPLLEVKKAKKKKKKNK
tara:strand:- start:199 stop:954 length:756 start_codon:yes stop_codon:yes gene_type:complete